MRSTRKNIGIVIMLFALSIGAFAQGMKPDLQNYRMPGYDGLNVFDFGAGNRDAENYDGFKVWVGGDFALQFQAINHSFEPAPMSTLELIHIGNNVNLPTANLNLDAQLAKGMRVHLRTYLSSRHHNESWVKGGYISINSLDFIKEGLAEDFMKIFSVRAGVDNLNYGDAVSRRTDNGNAIYNPFVGNYIMDANTVEPFAELNFFPGDFIIVAGIGTGVLNPTVVVKVDPNGDELNRPPSFHGKLGWDSEISEDLRVRVTGSFYTSGSYNDGSYMFNGDRAGARYYKVLDYTDTATGNTVTNDFSGRFSPRFKSQMAFVINPFVKFKGFEFFGMFEQNSGFTSEVSGATKGSYTQLGAELLYRFGSWDQFYVAGRFNNVSGNPQYVGTKPDTQKISRINFGGGWFMTKNTLVKLEYVSQKYNDAFADNLRNGEFNGVVLEAVINF